MFENVLVGVDGRPNGRDAITLAGQLVDRAGRLTLAHVHSGGLDPGQVPGEEVEERKERDASRELLQREQARAVVSAELASVAAPSPGRGPHLQAGASALICSWWAPATAARSGG